MLTKVFQLETFDTRGMQLFGEQLPLRHSLRDYAELREGCRKLNRLDEPGSEYTGLACCSIYSWADWVT